MNVAKSATLSILKHSRKHYVNLLRHMLKLMSNLCFMKCVSVGTCLQASETFSCSALEHKWHSRNGVLVRALASHQCGLGSILVEFVGSRLTHSVAARTREISS